MSLPDNLMVGSGKEKSISAYALAVKGTASGPKSFAKSSPVPSPTLVPTTVIASVCP